jgi:hypothetical protein
LQFFSFCSGTELLLYRREESVARKKKPIRYVWVAEDDKYGTLGVFATKKAADRLYGDKLSDPNWVSGFGGAVIKMRVAQ